MEARTRRTSWLDTRDYGGPDPGMRFQTFVLMNFYCPVVRPLCASSSPHAFWISQTNGTSPSSVDLVAIGLNYHFCSNLEAFCVNPGPPYVYFSSVAANVVKLLLIKIGVFAIDGIIFRIHGDQEAAMRDAGQSAGNSGAGPNSNFEIGSTVQAHLQPGSEPGNLSENLSDTQLEGTSAAVACHRNRNCGEVSEKSTVKNTLSTLPLGRV